MRDQKGRYPTLMILLRCLTSSESEEGSWQCSANPTKKERVKTSIFRTGKSKAKIKSGRTRRTSRIDQPRPIDRDRRRGLGTLVVHIPFVLRWRTRKRARILGRMRESSRRTRTSRYKRDPRANAPGEEMAQWRLDHGVSRWGFSKGSHN